MVSAEVLTTVNARVITKLYKSFTLKRKGRQRPAFNYLNLNQIYYLDKVMVHLIYLFLKMFGVKVQITNLQRKLLICEEKNY